GASSLMEMMLYYESATHLDISSSSSMGVSGWQALSRLLRQSGCLWRLDACNIPLLEFPAQALSKALLSSRLTVLHLENTCLSGKPLFTLGALKKNAALQELYLCDNELNSYQDAMQLGELLKYNRTLRTIDLGNNAVSDSLEELCDGLRVEKSGLRTLVLSNNQITHHGMTHLKSVLFQPFLRTLETLDLSKNNLENQGVHMLKEPLMMNRSITQLSLAAVGITCEAVVLAEVLAESRVLQTVDVRQNRVLTAGLMALALALRINHSVLRLDLDQNPKEEKDEFLIEIQKTLLSRISELCAANAAASAAVAAAAAAAVAAAAAASEIDA
uniref:Protein phosphatase 1 regulatory subunit 37 n=1 Tax=Astyanax mexicanus TaxID=7994 RepID=W5JZ52_ASTMX